MVVAQLFDQERYEMVVHLVAQAGARYSIEAPFEYVDSNPVGFMAILEGVRGAGLRALYLYLLELCLRLKFKSPI